MYLNKDETKRLIDLLKPRVSGFSHTFHQEGEHGQEVVCGGLVKSIVKAGDWTAQNDIVYVTLDDALGEILIAVPSPLWTDIKKEDVVLVEGVLFALKKECEFVSKAGTEIQITRKDEPLRVLTKSIKKITVDA